MFDVASARIVLDRLYRELESLSESPFTDLGYQSVINALLAFQANLDIDLNLDLEDMLLQGGYESVVEAVEDAALNGTVNNVPTEATYELALTQVRELQAVLDEQDPEATEADIDLLETYYELLQIVGLLADRDVVDVWAVFEPF